MDRPEAKLQVIMIRGEHSAPHDMTMSLCHHAWIRSSGMISVRRFRCIECGETGACPR